MMLPGAGGQHVPTRFFDASGTITAGGTAQLVVPSAHKRSSFVFQNLSSANMFLEFGSARATATLSSGTVASCSITNAGFGFSLPPSVRFYGGTNLQQSMPAYTLQGLPDWDSPSSVAKAHCVMAGSAPNMTVLSITIDDPGSGYAYPPYVFLINDPRDPYGCAVPSATVGIELLPQGSYVSNGVIQITDQISVFCATISSAYAFKYTL